MTDDTLGMRDAIHRVHRAWRLLVVCVVVLMVGIVGLGVVAILAKADRAELRDQLVPPGVYDCGPGRYVQGWTIQPGRMAPVCRPLHHR